MWFRKRSEEAVLNLLMQPPFSHEELDRARISGSGVLQARHGHFAFKTLPPVRGSSCDIAQAADRTRA